MKEPALFEAIRRSSVVQEPRCGMVNELYARVHRAGYNGIGTENQIMNPTQAKRLGAYLRRAREEAELSQARLAKRVGVDNTRILRLERGDNRFPAPEFLGAIADELGLDLFELYRRAGYAETRDLPSLNLYLRSKYGELPESATDLITAYAERLAKQHGVDLSGPAPGEDETPEEQPKKNATKKGGASHATSNRTNR